MELIDEIVCHFESATLDEFIIAQPCANLDTICRSIAFLHNQKKINALSFLDTYFTKTTNNSSFWSLQDAYGRIIPHLVADPADMLLLAQRILSAGGNDLAAGLHLTAFQQWIQETEKENQIFEILDQQNTSDPTFYVVAIQAVAARDFQLGFNLALDFLGSNSSTKRCAAAAAVGRLDFKGHDATAEAAVKALRLAARNTDDDELHGAILYALFALSLKSSLHAREATATALYLADRAGYHVLNRAALLIRINAQCHDEELITALGTILYNGADKDHVSVEVIDHAAAALIQHNKINTAKYLIERYVSAQQITALKMPVSAREMARLPLDQLGLMIIYWLRATDAALNGFAKQIASSFPLEQQPQLQIDFSNFGMDDKAAESLARKAVGYLFFTPRTASSILVSLLASGPLGAGNAIQSLLSSVLIRNFPGEVGTYLRAALPTTCERTYQHLKSVLDSHKAYIDDISSAGRIRELEPNETERITHHRIVQDAVRASREAAEKKSFIFSMASRRTLLYGSGSIYHIQDPAGNFHRQKMPLNRFTYHFEAPRMEALDAANLTRTLWLFRNAGGPE